MPSGIYKRTDNNLIGIRNFNKTKKGKKRPAFSAKWKKGIGLALKGRHPIMEFKSCLTESIWTFCPPLFFIINIG